MKKLKVRIRNEFGNIVDLKTISGAKFFFEYEGGRTLTKSNFKITDAEAGEGEIELSDFEISGLKEGVSSFTAQVFIDDDILVVEFSKGIKVEVDKEGVKAIL